MEDSLPTQGLAIGSEKRLTFSAALERLKTTPVLSDEAIQEIDRRDELNRRVAAYERLCKQAGSRLSEKATWDSFVTTHDKQSRVKIAVKEWAAKWPEHRGSGLVLFGPVGTGKDHLAFCACRELVVSHSAEVSWVNGRELFGESRDRIDTAITEREFFAKYASPQVLCISDPLPTVGGLTSMQADTLYRVVESRSARQHCTIFTVNVSSDKDADQWLGVATWDRICDGAWKLFCAWPSHRKPAFEIK